MKKTEKRLCIKIPISIPADLYEYLEKYLIGETRNRSEAISHAIKRELIVRGYLKEDNPLNSDKAFVNAMVNEVVPLRKATMDLLDAIAESEGKTRSDVIDNLIVKAVDPSIETERRGADRIVNRRRQTLTKDGFNEPQNGHHTDSGMVATARRKTAQGKTA